MPENNQSGLFPSTIEDALAELKREQTLRNRVYPAWVQKRQLRQEIADRQQAHLQRAIEIVAAALELQKSINKVKR